MTNIKDEAQATVKLDRKGKYYDLSKNSPYLKGRTHLTDKEFSAIRSDIRPRFMITPNCNAWCVFCSNEGSSYSTKSQCPMDIDLVIKLSEMLIESLGVKAIDFSGGEPLMHPDFAQRKYKLLKWTKKYPHIRFAIHTNGIALDAETVGAIKNGNISRLGISVHSVNFGAWNKITNRNNIFTIKDQKIKHSQLIKNLKYLAKQEMGDRVLMKSIVMRGVNDSIDELKSFLEATKKFNFHPRFIQYEPMYVEDKKNVVGRSELFDKLKSIGVTFIGNIPTHNSPDEYIPLVNFYYQKSKNTRMGLHGIIECGTPGSCISCYKFLVAFIKPTPSGKGAFLKPCSVMDTRLDLTNIIKNNDKKALIELFRLSRNYLLSAPGLNTEDWNKEK